MKVNLRIKERCKMIILVTGGLGYIGSHICVELLNNGHEVIVLDNLSNSTESIIQNIYCITSKKVKFIYGDIRDPCILDDIFSENKIESIVHCAGLKSVAESCRYPTKYYDNNVYGTVNLLKKMRKFDVKKIVFSSSATVYGNPVCLPIKEDHPLNPINPYGKTKKIIEDMLLDEFNANENMSVVCLRYFNPIGAHDSGLLGESPHGLPANLMPYISCVAMGKVKTLNIFGNTYNTPDGTGVRDYLHVVDLACAHIAALKYINENKEYKIINIGTGTGTSVLELIKTFEKVSGIQIPYKVCLKREGDTSTCYTDPGLAHTLLNWKAKYNIEKMCEDEWNYQLCKIKY